VAMSRVEQYHTHTCIVSTYTRTHGYKILSIPIPEGYLSCAQSHTLLLLLPLSPMMTTFVLWNEKGYLNNTHDMESTILEPKQ
jgi:hypothetical protein